MKCTDKSTVQTFRAGSIVGSASTVRDPIDSAGPWYDAVQMKNAGSIRAWLNGVEVGAAAPRRLSASTVVLSYGTAKQVERIGADVVAIIPGVIGRVLLLNAEPNEARNTFPALFLNDDDPGLITKVDESAYRYAAFPTLRGPVTVEMETPYANSEIRYTLNGKSPTPTSHLYVGPVVFKQNATGEKTAIRARVYDKRNSNVKSRIIRLEFRVLTTR